MSYAGKICQMYIEAKVPVYRCNIEYHTICVKPQCTVCFSNLLIKIDKACVILAQENMSFIAVSSEILARFLFFHKVREFL